MSKDFQNTVPLTEGKASKGGQNPPLEPGSPHPAPPEGSGGTQPFEKLKTNVQARKAAEAMLELIQQEFGEEVNDRFFEVLRDHCIGKVGLPCKTDGIGVKGYPLTEAAEVKGWTFPSGKYRGMSIAAVEDKDPDYLKRYPYRKFFFQLIVEKYNNRERVQKKKVRNIYEPPKS